MNVRARLAPPAPRVQQPVAENGPAPTPRPTPVPKLVTRTNIFLAIGGLVVLAIIGVIIGKFATTRSVD